MSENNLLALCADSGDHNTDDNDVGDISPVRIDPLDDSQASLSEYEDDGCELLDSAEHGVYG